MSLYTTMTCSIEQLTLINYYDCSRAIWLLKLILLLKRMLCGSLIDNPERAKFSHSGKG
jgi:hypothetical protein